MDARGCGLHYFYVSDRINMRVVITTQLVAKMGFNVALARPANIKEDDKHSQGCAKVASMR